MLIASCPKVGECAREGLMDKEVCINTAKGRFLGLRLPELSGVVMCVSIVLAGGDIMKLADWYILTQCDSRGGNRAAEVREIGGITTIVICQQYGFECAGPSANFKVRDPRGYAP